MPGTEARYGRVPVPTPVDGTAAPPGVVMPPPMLVPPPVTGGTPPRVPPAGVPVLGTPRRVVPPGVTVVVDGTVVDVLVPGPVVGGCVPPVPVVDGTSPVVDGAVPVVVDGMLGNVLVPVALVPPVTVPPLVVPPTVGVPTVVPPTVAPVPPVVVGTPPTVPGVLTVLLPPNAEPGVPSVLVPNDGAPIEPTDCDGASVDGVVDTPGVVVDEVPGVGIVVPPTEVLPSCANRARPAGRTRSPTGMPAVRTDAGPLADRPAASARMDNAANATKWMRMRLLRDPGLQAPCHLTRWRLDRWATPVLNSVVRGVAVLVLVLSSATALARPRVQVAPFSVRGEGMSYFGPEVARAVAASLEGAGVETGAGAEAVITGRVEALSGERVRLSATLHGHTLSAEGPLEAIDAVATQLANQIAPLLLENDPAAQRAAERRARDAERRAAAVPPSRPLPRPPAPPPAAPRPPEPAAEPPPTDAPSDTRPAAPAEAKPTAPADGKTDAKGDVKPQPAADAPAPSPPAAEPKQPEWIPPRVDGPPTAESPPTATRPRATAPAYPPAYPPPYFGGFVRGRVVAHAIADPPGGYPSAGTMATQALFSFLHRRMRLSVIPTGVGITPVSIAADEGYRAAARAVVMARLESVEYLPGPSARCRLEVEVVRDGRAVMRRIVESAPSDPNRRGLGSDPVYQAVTMGLEALVPELVGALADVR